MEVVPATQRRDLYTTPKRIISTRWRCFQMFIQHLETSTSKTQFPQQLPRCAEGQKGELLITYCLLMTALLSSSTNRSLLKATSSYRLSNQSQWSSTEHRPTCIFLFLWVSFVICQHAHNANAFFFTTCTLAIRRISMKTSSVAGVHKPTFWTWWQ